MTRHTDDMIVVGCGIAGHAAGLRATDVGRSVPFIDEAGPAADTDG